MKKLTDIDKNFEMKMVKKDNMAVYSVEEKPFTLYGVIKTEKGFARIPPYIAEKVNGGVETLNYHTSGGRIRFKTNSDYIVIKYVLPRVEMMMHMPLTGSSGFDLYCDGGYVKTFMGFDFSECAKTDDRVEYESIVEFKEKKMRDILINFPLYNAVEEVYIGLNENAETEEGNLYKYRKPIVFYGSSITQGGCVSRPGNAYPNILSRRFDADFINLGFSGSAMGETTIAEYISKLEMSVFVYDYDYNSPSVEHLMETHYRMYKIIRNANPNVPVIIASRMGPDNAGTKERMEVIKATYEKAIAEGDKNIYFIDGLDMFYSHDCEMLTVDGCHPNDFGSFCMAEKFEEVIRKVLL